MSTLLILSGGMDSSTALGMFRANISATLTFNYGSKHNARENYAAKALSDYYGVPNTLINLGFVNDHFKSDLLKSGGDVPDGHYADASMKRTVVPFRNGIMLAIACGLAESIGCSSVMLGNHVGDHAIYPDCRKEFTEAFAKAMAEGTYANVRLITPFGAMTKTDICAVGNGIGVPYSLTYSCYKGGEKHCGTCGTCVERKESFKDSGVLDPTEYLA